MRRQFLGHSATGIAALASLLQQEHARGAEGRQGILANTHHPARAKRVIYLFMSGGPSHIDLFDYKPRLRQLHGTELPASIRMGQRVTGMTSGQRSFPCVAPMFSFARHGQSGTWVSELLPHIGTIADDIAVVKSLHTEAINHDPATTYIQTGGQQPGRPALGAWLSYGLGSATQDLPAFVVMVSQGSGNKTDQPLFSRLWGAGFLPSEHQGVRFRSGSDPVLYLSNPPGIDTGTRRAMLDGTRALNELAAQAQGDPEINTRIAQYELAFRMQASVPELVDLAGEPAYIRAMYGLDRPHDDGGFARNCLLARRLIERGVRFVQLFHRGCDQPSAALIKDLKQRGLLEDTLVIWGGEFGRTVYSQGTLTATNHGRDHHGRCFSSWLAGGGIKPGLSYGATDDYCYNITENPVHIHDLNATMLHCLGIEHTRLTYRFQGRDFRLTDVHGDVIRELLA
jgi:hypothetical protein